MVKRGVAGLEGGPTGMSWGHVVKSTVSRDTKSRAQRWCVWQANTGPLTTIAEVRTNVHLHTWSHTHVDCN